LSLVLSRLAETLEARKGADPGASYVAGLYARGLDVILKKVGEEATETVIAAKNGQPEAVVRETADLWFHTLVMLARAALRVVRPGREGLPPPGSGGYRPAGEWARFSARVRRWVWVG